MADTKKKVVTKRTVKKVTKSAVKSAAKKTVVKKSVKKVAVKKVSAPKVSVKNVKIKAKVVVEKQSTQVKPTNYAEINRVHRGALANYKGTLVVTSSRANEGSSLYAHLMAQRSAECGSKVLLIDFNMRTKALSGVFDVQPSMWNLSGRDAKDKLNDLVQPVSGVKNLSFMSAPTDMGTVLHLKDVHHASDFFKTLEKQFDYIIVDTTPIGLMNRGNVDPVLLSAAAKRTVLVMLAGVTPRRVIGRALAQLKEAGSHVEGIVVNDRDNPSLKMKMMKFVNFVGKFAPGLSDWLRHKIIHANHI